MREITDPNKNNMFHMSKTLILYRKELAVEQDAPSTYSGTSSHITVV